MTTSVPSTPPTASTPAAVPSRRFVRSRLTIALVITLAAVTSLGACAAGPINVGTLPISGTSIYSVNVQACAPRAGALLITADYHEVTPNLVQLQITQWAPTDQTLPISSWAHDGLHWEFTTPSVNAGDCFRFFINSVSLCCDPLPDPSTLGFDYRIEYLD
jgi:hypothetical protein